MMKMIEILLLISGVWNVIFSIIQSTSDNYKAKLVYKAIPFFSGLIQIYVALKLLGLI